MEMMLIAAGAGGRVHPPGYHSQKQTRRDITDQRIMQNILQFNSPVISKDFSNLRLGPLKGGPKYHHRSPPVMNSKDFSSEMRSANMFDTPLTKNEKDQFNDSGMNLLEKLIET